MPIKGRGSLHLTAIRTLGGLFTAVLLSVSQSWGGFGPLAGVALVPWWRASEASGLGLRGVLLLALFTGTTYGCLVGYWVVEALQGLGSSLPSALLGLALTAVWAKAPLFAVMGVAIWLVRCERVWVVSAVVASVVFAGEWLVSHARWGIPWALLGHSQRSILGVSQLAVVGGVPLISALLATLNVAVVRALAAERAAAPRALWATAAAWGSLAALGFPLAEAVRPPGDGAAHQLLMVQPDIPRSDRWGAAHQPLNLRRVRHFIERSTPGVDGASVLLLPENLLTTPVDAHPQLASALAQWVDQLGVPVVAGLAMADGGGDPTHYRSAVVWLEPGHGIFARIDKARAVPVFESSEPVPGERLVAPLLGAAAAWRKVVEAPDAGPLRGRFTLTPALCYEALFPGLVARRRDSESVAIVNLADDGWVAGDAATRQLTRYAAFRAIEQRLTLIRVAHGGLSAVIDPFGRTLEELPLDTYAMTQASVTASPPPSFGEKFAIAALPVATGLVVWWAVGPLRAWRDTR